MQFETKSELIILFVAGISLLFLACGYIVYFLVFYQRNQQKNILEKSAREAGFQQELMRSQLEIKEQTLKHIGYELHDNLGQIASLIKINLNTLRLDDPDKAALKIESTKELVRQLITDLKALSVNLNSDRVVQLGLIECIKNEIRTLNRTGQFKTEFVLEGFLPELSPDTAIIIYRMVQESVNNIVKHSKAKHVTISLKVVENLFTLVIDDDGEGFNPSDELRGGGSGLINLQNRAKLINAQFSIQSSPRDGTSILIEMPI